MKIFQIFQKITDKFYIIFAYTVYFLINIFNKKNKNYLSKDKIIFFEKNNYIVINDFIDINTLSQINKLLENISNENLINESDIIKQNTKINTIADKLFKNLDIYYNFPKEIFNQYNFLRNPEIIFNKSYNSIISKIKIYSEILSKTKISIENFQVYNTLANGDQSKINSHWHKDGDLLNSFKVLIYLNDVDEDSGALKILNNDNTIIDLNGKAGTAIFFKAAKLLHSGSVPKKTSRWCLNFKIYPNLFFSSLKKNKPFNYLRRYNLFL